MVVKTERERDRQRRRRRSDLQWISPWGAGTGPTC